MLQRRERVVVRRRSNRFRVERVARILRGTLSHQMINDNFRVIEEPPTVALERKTKLQFVINLCPAAPQTFIKPSRTERTSAEAHVHALQRVDFACLSAADVMIPDQSP